MQGITGTNVNLICYGFVSFGTHDVTRGHTSGNSDAIEGTALVNVVNG